MSEDPAHDHRNWSSAGRPYPDTAVVTGHGDVDAALARLPELDTASTADHVAVFEDVHERLARTLSELDGG